MLEFYFLLGYRFLFKPLGIVRLYKMVQNKMYKNFKNKMNLSIINY